MPIKPEMWEFYPRDWPEISRRVQFERAAGLCQGCGHPHGMTARCLPDGRGSTLPGTLGATAGDGRWWPDLLEREQPRQTRVILAAAHLDHDPRNNRLRNLRGLCQRCHQIHDLPHRALGDLFLGPYSVYIAVLARGPGVKVQRRLVQAHDVGRPVSGWRRKDRASAASPRPEDAALLLEVCSGNLSRGCCRRWPSEVSDYASGAGESNQSTAPQIWRSE